MTRTTIVAVFGLILCAAACHTIHKTTTLEKDQAVAVDAKQRFLVTTQSDAKIRQICLEPSPDVFSVVSATLAANGKYGAKASADIKAALSEAGATIGTRTETIQLLRDAMYRICELSLNGHLTPGAAAELHKQYQKSMVTLAAVAALADASRPSQVALTSRATITPGTLMVELTGQLAQQREQLKGQQAQAESTARERDAATAHVCEKKVVAPTDCQNDNTKCGDDTTAQGKALCDLSTSTEDTKTRTTNYCAARKSEDLCSAVVEKTQAADDAASLVTNTRSSIRTLQVEIDKLEKNPDLTTATEVVQLAPTATRQDPLTIEKIAHVVDRLVTEVYADQHAARCLELLGQATEKNNNLSRFDSAAKTTSQRLSPKMAISGTTDVITAAESELSAIRTEQDKAIGAAKADYEEQAALLNAMIAEAKKRNDGTVDAALSAATDKEHKRKLDELTRALQLLEYCKQLTAVFDGKEKS